MYTNQNVTRGWEARHPQFMKPRDAEINFQCSPPDFVHVSEIVNGESIHSEVVRRHPDVVTNVETKYMFYADEAATARKLVASGCSCLFRVYFREP